MRRKKLRRTDSPSTICFDNLNEIDDHSAPICSSPPALWEPCGQACGRQAVHWRSGGLADYNSGSANLSDVQANDGAYHCSPARSPGEKAVRGLFPVKNTRSDPVRIIFACFPCRSSGRERTRMAGIRLSRFLKRAFLTLSIYSRWERPKSFAPKKFF